MTDFQLIPEEKYKEVAQKTNLNSCLRNFFTHMDSVEQLRPILEQAENARLELFDFNEVLNQSLAQDPYLNSLPLIFYQDRGSRNGSIFLRWKNLSVFPRLTGESAWYGFIQDPAVSKETKLRIIQGEKERLAYHMQMSSLGHMIKQISICIDKIHALDELEKKL